jgi:glucokinase
VLAARPAGVSPPRAVGMGTAGVVLPSGRVIAHAPNLPLDGYPLAEHLEARLQLPATILNDGRASAWGEYRGGAAAGRDPLLCLFFGTGVGVGLMVAGRPHGGADNAAGEIGHTVYRPGGRRCACGRDGHFEAYCGGRALAERAAAELGPPPAGAAAWTASALLALDAAAARAILQDAATAAAVLTANACTLLNPRAVVLGGGVLQAWPALGAHIEAFVRAECSAPIVQHLQFHASRLGSDAILVGAAAATAALWP